MRLRIVGSACFLIAIFSPLVHAQPYPSKPITMVVAYPPGGATDVAARLVANKLSEQMGSPLVVENKPGGGGTIGTDFVSRASPDGYTILMMVDTNTIAPALYTKLHSDPIKDFAPVTMVAVGSHAIVAHPSFAPNTVKEFIDYAKQHPGEAYASPGNGSGQHLGMESFKMMAGVDLLHVPFQGGGPALTNLTGGHVKVGIIALASALPFIKSGKLKAIAITGDKRSPALPNVPTVAEMGLPGFSTLQWFAVVAPAGTPPAVISRLHAEIVKAAQDPGFIEKLAAVALEPRTSPAPADLTRFMKEDMPKWPPIVKAAGVKID